MGINNYINPNDLCISESDINPYWLNHSYDYDKTNFLTFLWIA